VRPETKGGSEATVRVAKADLVPTEANLITAYATFREAVVACEELMATLNERPHRATRQPPAKMLAEERQHLHTLLAEPYAGALGETRAAPEDQTIGLRDVPYSTPPGHIGQEVWVRMEEVVVVGRDTGAAWSRSSVTSSRRPAGATPVRSACGRWVLGCRLTRTRSGNRGPVAAPDRMPTATYRCRRAAPVPMHSDSIDPAVHPSVDLRDHASLIPFNRYFTRHSS
jgi:hypothetical protein